MYHARYEKPPESHSLFVAKKCGNVFPIHICSGTGPRGRGKNTHRLLIDVIDFIDFLCIFLHIFSAGCSNFVSMDGIWKLRFPHCMYPVKSEVCGLPTLNYPSVCTKEPAGPQSALCHKHCEVAKSKGIPTELRAFVYDYCGVSRRIDGGLLI